LRTIFISFFCLISLLPAKAQRTCATADVIQQKIKDNPRLLKQIQATQQQMIQGQLQHRQFSMLRSAASPTVTIPVVVHIVLENPELVTDAQVLSQINVLNKDFTASNTDINQVPGVWQPIIGNAQIQFCLAQRTPENDPTTGIVRVKTTRSQFSVNNSAPDVKHNNTGGSDAWNPQQYLNIWVCRLDANNLGVATMPNSGFPADEDGVVILYTAFGTTGTAQPVFNLGRTTTHELGHYFGLYHIWGDDDAGGSRESCTVDDGIEDTPLQGKRSFGCLTFPKVDACSPNPPGIMFMNYMDYSDDACMHLFTAGQVDRMRYVLENLRTPLLTANGCTPVVLNNYDAAISQMNSPVGKLCDNGIAPKVILKNKGILPLTKVTINYTINNGTPVSYNWTGTLNSLEQAAVQLPPATVTVGLHTIQAYTSLPNGIPDQVPENDTTTGSFHYDTDATLPFQEGFEGNLFPPYGWEIFNPDNSFTWELTRDAAKTGHASVVMRNLGYSVNDQIDDLISPVVDSKQQDSVFLFFDIAAAVYSDPKTLNNVWDTLEIFISTDCTKTLTSVYKKWGPNLITRQTATQTEFIPTAGEWRRDSVDLTNFARLGKFQVVFRNTSNSENNIYLDDIQLIGKPVNPHLKEKGVLVTPNPTDGLVYVSFLTVPVDLENIALYNAGGQLVAQQPASAINRSNRFTFNLVNEPNGVYFVKLIYRNRAKTIKILKVR
jgi:hypothetical protein